MDALLIEQIGITWINTDSKYPSSALCWRSAARRSAAAFTQESKQVIPFLLHKNRLQSPDPAFRAVFQFHRLQIVNLP